MVKERVRWFGWVNASEKVNACVSADVSARRLEHRARLPVRARLAGAPRQSLVRPRLWDEKL